MIDTAVKVGDTLPTLTVGPISRATLALYAGASGDENPIHIDIDFAKMAGFDDVFAHGMLNMGYLGRLLTQWRPQSHLRKYSVRFKGMVQVHDCIHFSAVVRAIDQQRDRAIATLDLTATNQNGLVALQGEAIVML